MIAAALLASASIFHGTPVTPEQAPWLVTLTTRGPFCGGALIAPDRVLTAAHCVQGADPGRVSVRIGGVRHAVARRALPHDLPRDPLARGPGQPERVGDGRRPRGDRAREAGDRRPAAAASRSRAATVGEASQTVGTGRTGPDGGGGGAPRAATQTVSDACPAAYGADLFDPDKHLCTLDATPNASQACAGDSGSPVMVQRNGAWAVAGVVTWGGETYGRDCGEGLPDVSERVDAHAALLTATGAFAPVRRAPRPRAAHRQDAPLRDRRLARRRTRRSRCAGTAWPSRASRTAPSGTASRCTSTTPAHVHRREGPRRLLGHRHDRRRLGDGGLLQPVVRKNSGAGWTSWTVSAVPAVLDIRLLGSVELRLGGTPLAPPESARAVSLLAYLLVHRGAPQPRRRLAFLLWPDSTEAQARTNLRKALHTLRRALPDGFLDGDTQTLRWRADAPCTLDLAAFEDALERGDLRAAVEAYGGDLLDGSYDEWVLAERERLRDRYADALERLAGEPGRPRVRRAAGAARPAARGRARAR